MVDSKEEGLRAMASKAYSKDGGNWKGARKLHPIGLRGRDFITNKGVGSWDSKGAGTEATAMKLKAHGRRLI